MYEASVCFLLLLLLSSSLRMSIAVCATNFFKSGEVCVSCPRGSGRTVGTDPENLCVCKDGMVTSAGNVNTISEECVGE